MNEIRTVRRGTKAHAAVIANASKVRLYALETHFDGHTVTPHALDFYRDAARLQHLDEDRYRMTVTGNLWLDFVRRHTQCPPPAVRMLVRRDRATNSKQPRPSAVVVPGRRPASMSARFTQPRNVSGLTPTYVPIRCTAAFNDNPGSS